MMTAFFFIFIFADLFIATQAI